MIRPVRTLRKTPKGQVCPIRGGQSSRGFTLIEVMLGMTLLGIMMVLLFGTVAICARSWEGGENKIAEVSEAGTVYHFFKRYAAVARPVWDDFSEPENRIFAFQGQPDSLRFVAAFPASVARPGLQLFTVAWLKEAGDLVLKVTITPFFPVAEGEQWSQEEIVILRDVRDFRISYFDGGLPEESAAWADQWVERETLPPLIKVTIARSDERYWPPMTIPLRLAVAGAGDGDGVEAGGFD